MQIASAKYLGSFPTAKACPRLSKPEYAFVGRSNVGKSSLINMLCQRKELARVSNTPGKTQSINLYEIDEQWVLADLPGYGYAKVSKKLREGWSGMIRDYLQSRENLMVVFVLLDLRLPLQKIDRDFIHSLGENSIPFALIYTKADKVVSRLKVKHRKAIENALKLEWEVLPSAFQTSAVDKEGRDDLLGYIGDLNSQTQETEADIQDE